MIYQVRPWSLIIDSFSLSSICSSKRIVSPSLHRQFVIINNLIIHNDDDMANPSISYSMFSEQWGRDWLPPEVQREHWRPHWGWSHLDMMMRRRKRRIKSMRWWEQLGWWFGWTVGLGLERRSMVTVRQGPGLTCKSKLVGEPDQVPVWDDWNCEDYLLPCLPAVKSNWEL